MIDTLKASLQFDRVPRVELGKNGFGTVDDGGPKTPNRGGYCAHAERQPPNPA